MSFNGRIRSQNPLFRSQSKSSHDPYLGLEVFQALAFKALDFKTRP